jgi:Na+/H+-dicarboxylate symporter
MLVLLGWILLVAPIGVFALAFAVAARAGGGAAVALAAYVLLLSGILFVCLIAMYPLAVFGGRIPLRRFAAAMLPAQVIAFSTRTSMVALPALVDAAKRRLQLPDAAASVVLPLAVATLRMSTAVGQVVTAIFAAHLYGVPLSASTVVLLAVMAAVLSFSVPGSVSAGFFGAAIVLMQIAKVPVEAAAILLAVDAIPDMFKTVLNVTSHMSATTVVARWLENDGPPQTVSVAASSYAS